MTRIFPACLCAALAAPAVALAQTPDPYDIRITGLSIAGQPEAPARRVAAIADYGGMTDEARTAAIEETADRICAGLTAEVLGRAPLPEGYARPAKVCVQIKETRVGFLFFGASTVHRHGCDLADGACAPGSRGAGLPVPG